jgi:hypothetical protein
MEASADPSSLLAALLFADDVTAMFDGLGGGSGGSGGSGARRSGGAALDASGGAVNPFKAAVAALRAPPGRLSLKLRLQGFQASLLDCGVRALQKRELEHFKIHHLPLLPCQLFLCVSFKLLSYGQ